MDKYIMKITGTSSDGRGVARLDNMAVFVSGAVEGDEAEVVITKTKKRFAEGYADRIIMPSVHRIQPECPYFGKCGGCVSANTDYAFELEKKADNVVQAMRRIGGFEDFKVDGIESGKCIGYRNKAVYKLSGSECGFFSEKSHSVTNIDYCRLCDERDGEIISAVRSFSAANGDCIKELFVRRGKSTGMTMVALKADKPIKNINELAAVLGRMADSVILNTGKESVTLCGKERIEDELLGIKFAISDKSFYQVNPEMTERLYLCALEYAALTGSENVLDIYCGIGTISLCAARRAAHVAGVEIVKQAVEDARANAERNGIKNAEFFASDAAAAVPRLIAEGKHLDVVILDPPRAGSDENTLNAVLTACPERIVYVSCNPATLARDCRILSQSYKITAATAFDMFPRTAHVETVCQLVLRRSPVHINIDVDVEELVQDKRGQATYEQIKDYVLKHNGLKVSSLYIAQIKRKCGIIERENYNKPKSEDAKQPQCSPEKEAAIMEALKHFHML